MEEYFQHTRTELLEYLVKHYSFGPRVMNIGCASGMDSDYLYSHGVEWLEGIEPNLTAANAAMERYSKVHHSTLEEAAISGTFDSIIFADSLEHMLDHDAALARAFELLRDDGLLLISVPNVRHLSVVVPLIVSDEFKYEDSGILDRTHLHFFTQKSIERTVNNAGFTILRTQRFGAMTSTRLLSALFRPLGGLLLSQVFVIASKTHARTP